MSYEAVFTGWNKLELADLLVAYRKAKADVFFENIFPTAINFADFEQDLLNNLDALLAKLRADSGFAKNKEWLGHFRIIPKKLRMRPKPNAPQGHVHFSDANRAFESLLERQELSPAFRIVGDFPVEMHIISALWINMIGHKLDACLDDTAYGSRLRRIQTEELAPGNAKRPFHITAVGSFQPYYQPYQRWRYDGLKAIRVELEQDREVIAVSLDLRSFYHQIDPSFLGSDFFFEAIGLKADQALTSAELAFTRELSHFLSTWSAGAARFAEKISKDYDTTLGGGLVIGLSASRIISNALLQRWDKLVQEKVTPVHYGRYVDDMFLVLRDPGNLTSMQGLMGFLQQRLGEQPRIVTESVKDETWEITLGQKYQKGSVIQLQKAKQKLFVLKGQSGLDLLESIEKDIHELSSEYRLMPSPDQLEHSTAAKVLSAAESVADGADTLRRADDLTIRRLSWSLQMRHVETLSRDLPKSSWKRQRDDFYQFAQDHILRADKIFDHFSYLPRLLGFSVALDEWQQAESIVGQSFRSIEQLASATGSETRIEINGIACQAEEGLWNYVQSGLAWFFINAAAQYYNPDNFPPRPLSKRVERLADIFLEQRSRQLQTVEDFRALSFGVEEFYKKAPLLASCDLAKVPYKDLLRKPSAKALFDEKMRGKNDKALQKAVKATGLVDTESLEDFLRQSAAGRLRWVPKSKHSTERRRAYLFPTRPYSPAEVVELVPWCVGIGKPGKFHPAEEWARYVRALRGVWVKPTLVSEQAGSPGEMKPKKNGRFVRVGTSKKTSVVVAITNLLTTETMWAASASGKPDLSLERYKAISELVNQAIRVRPRPDYLLFPELSLPREWVRSLTNRLSPAGINLVAGTEYSHPSKETIVSHACLQLSDDRLGFPTSVRIWQEKRLPAVGEEKELTRRFGKTWASSETGRRHVYLHNGFCFGVMVCSELQNSKDRVSFQGCVDALMVLSWNQDLDTFSALVESAALDVHAYVVLVNNRKYGDSRVRSPGKESYDRDLARLRGGENDFCVTVRLDVKTLRAFQSRSKRWPEKHDPFKPVPEGFRTDNERIVKPPK